MEKLFVLQNPWWMRVLRGVLVYLGVIVMLRFSGKREVGQFTPFDLALLLIVSEAVSNALSAQESSWTGAMLSVASMLAVNQLIGVLTFKFRRFESLFQGDPEFVIRNGRVDYRALQRLRLRKRELLTALRKQGCMRPSEMAFAVLKPSGSITVKKCGGKAV